MRLRQAVVDMGSGHRRHYRDTLHERRKEAAAPGRRAIPIGQQTDIARRKGARDFIGGQQPCSDNPIFDTSSGNPGVERGLGGPIR